MERGRENPREERLEKAHREGRGWKEVPCRAAVECCQQLFPGAMKTNLHGRLGNSG